MKFVKTTSTVALAFGAMLAITTSSALAKDLRYAIGFPPNSTGSEGANAAADYARELSGGELNIEVFPKSLLSFPEMSGGLRDGLADIGYVLFPYAPAEYPNANMIAEMTMLFATAKTGTLGGLAWTGALTEYLMLHCPQCIDEMKAQNQVFTSTASTEYTLMCTKKIETAEDMNGIRMRVPGAHWSRWAAEFGATSVSIPITEIFEALSQGIIDCAYAGTQELDDMSLNEVVKYILLDLPGGGFGGSGQMNVNLQTWSSLTSQQKTDLLKTGSFMAADINWRYRDKNAIAFENATALGIEAITPAPDFRAATLAFIEKDLKNIGGIYERERGLKNTQESIDVFLKLFEKWVDLVANVESAEQLAELYWTEAGSKVDVETYAK